MQCPDCGTEVADLVHGSCPSCASRRLRLMTAPDVVTIVVCAHCGRVEEGPIWVEPVGEPEAVLLDRMRRVVTVHAEVTQAHIAFDTTVHDPRHTRVETRLEGTFHGVPVTAAGASMVRIRNGVCNDCSRQAGGYFEAVVQVRGHPERPLKGVENVQRQVGHVMDRLNLQGRQGAFLSKVEQVKGGMDFYVGSTEVGRVLVRELVDLWGAEPSETAKLVGRTNDGRDQFRVTMLIRLPPYGVGDFVELDGAVCKVLAVAKRTVRVLNLTDWSTKRANPKRAESLHRLGGAEDEKDAVVVSRVGPRIQVLDPVTYKTVDLDLPRELPSSDELRVFRHDETLYVVPDASALKDA